MQKKKPIKLTELLKDRLIQKHAQNCIELANIFQTNYCEAYKRADDVIVLTMFFCFCIFLFYSILAVGLQCCLFWLDIIWFVSRLFSFADDDGVVYLYANNVLAFTIQ